MVKEARLDTAHPSFRLAVPEAGWRTATCLCWSQEQRCETRTLQGEKAGYLSKFSPGLLFLHSSMCNQVVEDLSCKTETQKERQRELEDDKEFYRLSETENDE